LSAQVAEKLVVNEDMKDLVLEEDEFPDNLVSGFSVAVDKLNDKRYFQLRLQDVQLIVLGRG